MHLTGKLALLVGRKPFFFSTWASPLGCLCPYTWQLTSPGENIPESETEIAMPFMTSQMEITSANFCWSGVVSRITPQRCPKTIELVNMLSLFTFYCKREFADVHKLGFGDG